MTSSRAYRPAFTKEKAIEELKKASGSQFNPKVVDAFIEVLREEE
jgi:HD-GYP domain-containing protein (c-di-GMP phosphodiesterase class II)